MVFSIEEMYAVTIPIVTVILEKIGKGIIMSGSEVALLRQQIAEEYIAATLGLSGLTSGTARHQFITQRMEAMGQHAATLEALVGQEEAGRMIADVLEPL